MRVLEAFLWAAMAAPLMYGCGLDKLEGLSSGNVGANVGTESGTGGALNESGAGGETSPSDAGAGGAGTAGASGLAGATGEAGNPSLGGSAGSVSSQESPTGLFLTSSTRLNEPRPAELSLRIDICPLDQVLVGVEYDASATIVRLNGLCGTLAIEQSNQNAVVTHSGARLVSRGQVSRLATPISCPAGAAITGVSGVYDGVASLVTQLAYHCAPVTLVDGTERRVPNLGATQPLPTIQGNQAGDAPFALVQCPAGYVARGLTTRFAEQLRSTTLICGKLEPRYADAAACSDVGLCRCARFDDDELVFCSTRVTKADAARNCTEAGKRLVQPPTSEENSWIRTTSSWFGYHDELWMGVNRGGDGAFVFDDGYAVPQVMADPNSLETAWAPGEPNGLAGENCVEMWGSEQRWNDRICTVLRGYACQAR